MNEQEKIGFEKGVVAATKAASEAIAMGKLQGWQGGFVLQPETESVDLIYGGEV